MGELEALAEQRGIDWPERREHLPDDPVLRLGALATLLGLDAFATAMTAMPIDAIVSSEAGAEDVDRIEVEMRRAVADTLGGA